MNRKMYLVISASIILTIIIACQVSFQTESATATPQPTPEPTQAPTSPPPQPTATDEQPAIPTGWLTYQNLEVGFEISYPPEYTPLDDETNLYGWPHGLVLLYNGGQSYDVAIEIWDSEQEILTRYPVEGDRITTFQSGNKFISVFNITQEAENAAVVATFQLLP